MDMVTNKRCRSLFAAFLILCFVSCDTSEQDFEKAKEANTIESYEMFVQKHPNSVLADEARDSVVAFYGEKNIKAIPTDHLDKKVGERLRGLIDHMVDSLYQIAESENSIASWKAFSYAVPQGYAKDSYERRAALIDAAYQKAEKSNTISGWKSFIDEVPPTEIRDAKDRIRELEEQAAWSTESKAWQIASSRGTELAIRKYLELYPYGSHARQAEKKLIDIEVAAVFAGEHGMLPQMDKGYSTGASYSVIELENQTQYELTVSYSGPDSKRIVIPARGTRKVNVGNGHYRVAATVGHGVIPFAGTEQLDGSYFSSSFYISTTRSRY